MRYTDILLGVLEHEFYDFPYIGNNNPNWGTHIFQRCRYTTNQIGIMAMENCHLYLKYLLNMVILHSYVKLPEGNSNLYTQYIGNHHQQTLMENVMKCPHEFLMKRLVLYRDPSHQTSNSLFVPPLFFAGYRVIPWCFYVCCVNSPCSRNLNKLTAAYPPII